MPEVSVCADICSELEKEINDLKETLQTEMEPSKKQELEKALKTKENDLQDIQNTLEDNTLEEIAQSSPLRRSARKSAPTPKMLALQKEMAEKKTQAFLNAYEKWKPIVCNAKTQLKTSMTESELEILTDSLVKMKEDIFRIYDDIRKYTSPGHEIRRKVDACESVSNGILTIAYDRMAFEETDALKENQHMRKLIKCDN